MKKVFCFISFLFISSLTFAQEPNDSLPGDEGSIKDTLALKVEPEDTTAVLEQPIDTATSEQQPKSELETEELGVAVSPSSLRYNVKPGTTQTKTVKVTNDSKKTYKFQIGFSDFQMDRNGKPQGIKPDSKYALSKRVSVSPSYFELKPGQVQSITIIVDIPNEEAANIAGWTIMMIDQVVERAPLDIKNTGNAIALGAVASFGFGVYIYQNPPNVKVNSVDIQNFTYREQDNKRILTMEAKNTGDGIGFCTSYVELTNLNTGKQERLQVKQFTILPEFQREFNYLLPKDLAAGKYSAVGVLDFGSKEQIVVAELEFDVTN